MHRAGPATSRERDRLGDDEILGAGRSAEARLDQGAQHGLMVEDLVRVALGERLIDTTGDEEQRHAILLGVGDDVDRIRNARPERRNQDRLRAGRVPQPLSHEAGRILMLGEQEANVGALQRIDERQHLAAGNAEGMGRTRRGETGGDEIGPPDAALARARAGAGGGNRVVAHRSLQRSAWRWRLKDRNSGARGYSLTET